MATLGKTTTPTTATFGYISNSNKIVALQVTTTQGSLITSVSFWAAGASATTIYGRIWDSTGANLAIGQGVATSGGAASGVGASQWYTDTLATPLFVPSGTVIYIGWQPANGNTVDWAYNGNDHSPNAISTTGSGTSAITLAGNNTESPNGAVAVYVTYTPAQMYVRRSNAWSAGPVDVRRSNAWSAANGDYARRSGSWNPGQ